ncbi:MAG TPA: hypothetical protein VF081_13395 [Solirubrobacterales bacterium]
MLTAERDYRETFLELATAEGLLEGVGIEDIERDTTRDDLGITSLNVIMLIANHLQASAPDVELNPAWVPELEGVEGIASVLRKIDELRDKAGAGA